MQTITKSLLGKELDDLEVEYIKTFFLEEREESDKIEFKSFFYEKNQDNFKHKENGVIKTICGFLNSSGGVIIWGAPKGEKIHGENRKVFKGDLSPVDKKIEKDDFISKISNRITPIPSKVRFHKVEVDIENNEYVYVIEVSESITKPHQFDDRYYIRLDGQTQVAPHHYIEALFKQIKYPNIEGYVKLNKITPKDIDNYILSISIFLFNFSPYENEYDVHFGLMVDNGVFAGSTYPLRSHKYTMEGHSYNHTLDRILYYGSPNVHNESILVDYSKVTQQHNGEVNLILNFGGKKSPLKFSSYKLNFNKYNSPSLITLLESKEENILAVDKQEALGTTRESLLKDLLGN